VRLCACLRVYIHKYIYIFIYVCLICVLYVIGRSNQVNHNVTYASEGIGGGAAAVFVLVTDTHVCVAGVGDCRAILVQQQTNTQEAASTQASSALKTTRMSIDHKFDPVKLSHECARAVAAGAL
jgi:serine/threonine protein phosphatase PrpC